MKNQSQPQGEEEGSMAGLACQSTAGSLLPGQGEGLEESRALWGTGE